ncbi:hypothetical protein [Streptomyces sp. NPDC058548]|uniref:hypothetical protein n=1 Tax=Streptomyces sp. NPDC058548 TaxID=3346545 RepID=UPI00365FF1F1
MPSDEAEAYATIIGLMSVCRSNSEDGVAAVLESEVASRAEAAVGENGLDLVQQ